MTIVVTGTTGLLGPYLLRAAEGLGEPVVGLSRRTVPGCDLTDAVAVGTLLGGLSPRLVVHAAGYTDVDGCEREPVRARLLNRDTTANVARALPASAKLIYLSTDQVYPDQRGPHTETTAAPVNAYGRSKLDGEGAALARPDGLVLRITFFGPSLTLGRKSLSDFVSDGLRARHTIPLFTDVSFTPLHMNTLAGLVFEMGRRDARGVFNVGCRAGASKRDFGWMVARHLGLQTDTTIDAVSTTVPGRAQRPRDLRMDVAKIEAFLGRPMPTLAEEVARL